MEIDHIRPQKMGVFLCHKEEHWAKCCRSRSVNAIVQVREPETGEVHCWRCAEVGHLKRNCPRNSRYQYQQHTRDKTSYHRLAKQEPGKLVHSNHVEANGERKLDNDMSTFKIELAGNPNSCIIKINKQMLHALLESGAEVSPIHTRVYNSLKEKPKLKKQSAFLQSVKSGSTDGCASLKYEIVREKHKHEFFVVLEMNRNIILGRNWLK